ncbi:hypothetical protein Nepgr_002286 [Nepenthes gracilis]|uniref:BZIP domain-containing protein n=1 Tax=Nepenthes gracilis TaxID=150966 RepID=A0AAD3P6S5_NEPGR|nr:hypothetical protein Nepgr_002286 [Nepenthes gracilis]
MLMVHYGTYHMLIDPDFPVISETKNEKQKRSEFAVNINSVLTGRDYSHIGYKLKFHCLFSMGNSDEVKSLKSDGKSSSPAVSQEQTNVQLYPDWAAMQAYYGPRVALPQYFNSAVASGHPPPPYMWCPPQPMMPPYGAPYAAIYSHGGVYVHPAVPLGSQSLGQGVVSSPTVSDAMATPLSMDTPLKSSGNTDKGLMKKLKSFDGLAMSMGNSNVDQAEGAAEHRFSQSAEIEGSSDGSDGNTEEQTDQNKRKRSHEGLPISAFRNEKMGTKTSPPRSGKVSSIGDKVLGVPVTQANATGKIMGTVLPPSMATTLELRNPGVNTKDNSTTVPSTAIVPCESLLQDERELKREKRKQSNRESARRSRLRKQAEAEELAGRVEYLTAENISLKSEINQLTENSGKLRCENALLMEKLKSTQAGQSEGIAYSKADVKKATSALSTENLLSRVKNNSGSTSRSSENSSNSGAKFHQLSDSSPRADAVAAG